MVEIVNLRRARKARAKAEKEKAGKANRVLHGTPKHLRNLAEARKDKADLALSGHKLEMPGGVGAVPSDNVGTSNQKEDNK